MKRSYFSILFALFIGATMFSACGVRAQTQQQQQQEEERRIYIQLWSLNRYVGADFRGTIESVAQMGYAGVELFGFNNGMWFGLTPTEVREIVEETGMRIVSSHVHKALAPEPKETDWDAIWEFWELAFQAHREAGIKYLVDPAVGAARLQTLEHVLAYAEYFNEIGRRAAAYGLRFGYHNHAWELEIKHNGQSVWDILIENTCPELVFFQLDVYWVARANSSDYVVELFNRFPGRFHLLHIKDTGALGAPDIGIMNFEYIFNNLENSGAMYMIVEIERVEDQMGAAAASIEYLKSVPWFRNNYR